jgi:dihydrofolate synthase/folylpolyglutamate synthase
MSYETAVEQLYALGHELANTPSHKFDLAHMRALLGGLDNPERKFPSVLIAGTNGKGSTAATLASILRASGIKTGLYTSPHLVRINERIRVSGTEIGDLPWHPRFFEMMTAIAFEYFAREKIEIAVLEVGMGGRLDATNVVEPQVSVITDIALDHQKFLGETVAEIAREKAGIIRRGGVVVTLPQQPQANDVIGNTILDLDAKGVSAVPYVPPVSPASAQFLVRGNNGKLLTAEGAEAGAEDADKQGIVSVASCISRYPLNVMGQQITVETSLVGRHQLRNIALAVAAAEELSKQGLAIAPEAIERGIRETRWPGRFQVVRSYGVEPEYVFDVAHNPAGAWALRSTLSACYEDRRLIFVFGAMKDKAIGEMAEILFPLAERVIATHADNPRAATPHEIREAASRTSTSIEDAADVATALARTRSLAGPETVVVITGSIYIVGEAMRILGVKA